MSTLPWTTCVWYFKAHFLYKNGDLPVKGLYKETPGHLTEWDGYSGAVAVGASPVNTSNAGRQELLRLFWDGKKVELHTKILFPVTETLDRTPLNSANRIGFAVQQNPNTFYLLSCPNDSMAIAPKPKDCATQAANCHIRINEMKIKTKIVEFEKHIT